jgi:hypothetical protein
MWTPETAFGPPPLLCVSPRSTTHRKPGHRFLQDDDAHVWKSLDRACLSQAWYTLILEGRNRNQWHRSPLLSITFINFLTFSRSSCSNVLPCNGRLIGGGCASLVHAHLNWEAETLVGRNLLSCQNFPPSQCRTNLLGNYYVVMLFPMN